MSVAGAALWLMFGCADDMLPAVDSGSPDSGAIDSGVVEDANLGTMPDPPLLPVLTPCSPGWVAVDLGDGSPVTCDPFPSPPTEPCGPGEAQFPGEEGCAAIGPECPADGWPAELPTDRPVLYVRADAAAGGDGTLAAPFVSITDAVDVAASGSVIAVARGRYVGAVDVFSIDISIRGACLETFIESGGTAAAVTMRSTTSDLRNMSLVGPSNGLIISGATVDLTSVEIALVATDRRFTGATLRNSTLTGESVVMRGPMLNAVFAHQGSTIGVRRAVLEGAREQAVSLSDSIFRGESLVINGFGSTSADGQGFYALGPGEITLTRSAIINGIGSPVLTADPIRVTFRNSLIRGRPTAELTPAGALAVIRGGVLTLDRVSISRMRTNAIVAAGAARLEATDVFITNTVGSLDSPVGYGIELAEASTASMRRVFIDRSTAVGLLLDSRDTVVDATDLTIVHTRGDGGGTFGRAIQVQRGGVLTLNRADLRDNREVAISVARTSSSLTATNLRLVDTRQRQCAEDGTECAAAGIGIGAYEEGAVSVDRFLVAGNFLAGVQVATDGSLDLANGVVERNPVGANIQVPGYDVTRLTTNVLYRDNGANLDSAELTVPAPDVGIR